MPDRPRHGNTGRPIKLAGFDMLRIEGDRFAELWQLEDNVSMLQQRGVIPGPPT
jgi:hypothetical protein